MKALIQFIVVTIVAVVIGTFGRFIYEHRIGIADLITANAGLLCFGAAAILAMIMVAIAAYWHGWEDCCRANARHVLDETRRQTSERI